ncbi:MAG: hypothetical protein DRJ38_03295 [Thermoprotei archaeon]|nr:MAG: hypothetical protein DRJ38_03295 [Thermoprotei archaeon]
MPKDLSSMLKIYGVIIVLLSFLNVWMLISMNNMQAKLLQSEKKVRMLEEKIEMLKSGKMVIPIEARSLVIGVSGNRFTLNGRPIFLLGISAFDAIGKMKDEDLDELRRLGFNLIRVWADWRENTIFNPDGSINFTKLNELKALVEACAKRRIVVDLALFDSSLTFGDDQAKRRKAAEILTRELLGFRNMIFDVMNEHDHSGATMTHEEVKEIRDIIKSIDPNRVVTVSSCEEHLITSKGELVEQNILEEVNVVKVDVLTPHLPRTEDWWNQTARRVQKIRGFLNSINKSLPIYLQEENRRGWGGFWPTKDQFLTALRQAYESGAAGWVFHTDAGFDLSSGSIFTFLDDVEKEVVKELRSVISDDL